MENLLFLGVPILKHIRVSYPLSCVSSQREKNSKRKEFFPLKVDPVRNAEVPSEVHRKSHKK